MDKLLKELRLLPPNFNKIAYSILAGSILFLILAKVKTFPIDKELAKTITKSGVLISLLMLAMTKEKIEDELIQRIRVRAFSASFIFGAIFVIIEPFTNLAFKGYFLVDKGAADILILMLLIYFSTKSTMKMNR